ncbi:unnamed protein product [Brachionus calyciflorus]|uniref:Uncharacterized protein n=1 Tax=Brachionus calyciflorus TaxID=104777 RepID=A0A814FSL2_9BILA|nr:unnamed protein product [Brachionus calyciflorus]
MGFENTILEEPNEYILASNAKELTKETILSSKNNNLKKRLRIIHFNDVYNIEPSARDPKGGAARFLTALNYLKAEEPCLVMFSGDIFSPSPLSMVTKGKQMVPILNRFNVDIACVGNHDFDFGVDTLNELIAETTFPWLISNVVDAETNKPIAIAESKHIIHFKGIKIGVIGLVEQEWMETLSTIDFDEIIYEDFVLVGKRLANELRNVDKVDYVIALTHMRLPNDLELAEEVPEIDLILGGHDHNYVCESVNGKWVVKSGTDFRELSLVEIGLDEKEKRSTITKIERYVIDSRVPEDDDLKSVVNFYLSQGEKDLDRVLGNINSDLDGRFSIIRSCESNLGNFVCDIVLQSVSADCTIINSGTFRSDTITPAGLFTVGDLKKIIPFPDPIVLIECDGRTIHLALENGVSMYPKLEGRFPQVAGIEFSFDPSKPSGQRVDPNFIKIQDDYLDFNRNYRLATKAYMKEGKDGYTMFNSCKCLMDDEEGPLIFSLVENNFVNIQKLKSLPVGSTRRPSFVPLVRKTSIIKELMLKASSNTSSFTDVNEPHLDEINYNSMRQRRESRNLSLQQALHLSKDALNNIKSSDSYLRKLSFYEEKSLKCCPIVDGRIICIKDKDMVEKLTLKRQEWLNVNNLESQHL